MQKYPTFRCIAQPSFTEELLILDAIYMLLKNTAKKLTLHKKLSFPLRTSLVNVTKSAGTWGSQQIWLSIFGTLRFEKVLVCWLFFQNRVLHVHNYRVKVELLGLTINKRDRWNICDLATSHYLMPTNVTEVEMALKSLNKEQSRSQISEAAILQSMCS